MTEEEEDPESWREAYDSDGDLYYWHLRTRRTTWAPPHSSSSAGKRRKKKRKRTTPRTSSHSSRGRAHRRQRQWYVHCWCCCFGAPHTVFPSFVGRTELPGIIVGMNQKDFFHRACRRLRQWHLQGWFCWLFRALSSFLLSFTGPGCSASWPVWTRRTALRFLAVACAWLVLQVILHLALYFSLLSSGPDVRHHCRYGPDGQLCGEILAVACARLVLLVFCTSRCVPPVVLKPKMLGIMAGMNQRDSYVSGCSWFRLQKTGFSTFIVGRRFSCRGAEADSHGLAVQQTTVLPSCSSWTR